MEVRDRNTLHLFCSYRVRRGKCFTKLSIAISQFILSVKIQATEGRFAYSCGRTQISILLVPV